MKITEERPTVLVDRFGVVGHPGDVAPANGAYRCLCCGVMLWNMRKGRRFPDCPSANCPTIWLWAEP